MLITLKLDVKTRSRPTQTGLKHESHGILRQPDSEMLKSSQQEERAIRRGGRVMYRFVEGASDFLLEAKTRKEIQLGD
jgi:hypothetical protein